MTGSIRIPDLYQGEEWTTQEGVRLKIKEMTRDHVRNLLAFLERRADDLAFADTLYTIKMPLPDMDTMAYVAVTSEIDHQADLKNHSVDTWLNALPLVKALRARLEGEPENEISDFLGTE